MDDLKRSLLNVFTHSDLNRMVHQRKDAGRLASLKESPSTRFVLFHQDRFLVSEKTEPMPFLATSRHVDRWKSSVECTVYLGCRGDHHYFALDFCDALFLEGISTGDASLAGLREFGHLLKAEDATLLSYSKALFHWHRAHKFCGNCGSATESFQGGHCRRCTKSECAMVHFPRTDPAIIVAVTKDGKCLFGRQGTWPESRYSVIAGFVEPGESVEQAVVREVLEETDIRLESVNYHSSQPWPFPGSVMLGFTATAASQDISLNDGELQDAHWRDVDEVVDGLKSQEFRVPPNFSIAYRLIEDWFNSHSPRSLSTVLDQLGAPRRW